MPFSKYTVDPHRLEAMCDAFPRVCGVLQLDCCSGDQMILQIANELLPNLGMEGIRRQRLEFAI